MAKLSRHVRLFLRVATLRFAEAERLRGLGLTLAAVYLAGYAVECVLKALLSAHPEHRQAAELAQFRGQSAHDYSALLARYRAATGGRRQPQEVTQSLIILGGWKTDLRYRPVADYDGDVDSFFASARVVSDWARRSV